MRVFSSDKVDLYLLEVMTGERWEACSNRKQLQFEVLTAVKKLVMVL
jgi:hypothetical protein